MATKSAVRDQLSIVGLLNDFRLLLILYFSFRVLIFLVYQPLILNETEIGIAVGGDFRTYFALGQLTGEDLLPFRDWWSEFPPIPAYLITGIYGMLGETPNYTSFASIFGILMLAADVGNLFLIRRIASRLHGDQTAMALCWIYALLVAPAIFMWWNFEPLVTFWLLLSLWWLLRKADVRSALAAGIGALTKFTPALLLGAVFRFRKPQHAARYTVIAAAVFALVYGALFIQNARMTTPSLTAQFGKASYQTVWALLDGNYRTGNFGPLEERFDPAKASEIIGNPSVVPGWLRLAVAAAIGLWVFTRVRRFDERGLVAFVALTLLIFFLQAQGYSPQWQVQIIPLMLLALPTRTTILSLVMLMALSFVEYPLLFSRTGDTGGAISGGLVLPYALVIVLRTLLLISFCVELYRKLRQQPAPELAPLKILPVSPRFIVTALIIALLLVRLVPAPTFTDAYYHFNAAARLAGGQGLTDAYLWQYIGAPNAIPAPSHLYWMPLTSLTAAAGMALLNAPGDHAAAQLLFIPMLAFVGCVGFWLGKRLGGSARHAWLAGLLTLFSGFFVRFWGSIDTFTPYAFAGALCLLATGLALERGKLGWWALAGASAALGHLARADGLLLVVVGALMIGWLWDRVPLTTRALRLLALVGAYLLVMSPWFARNLNVIGTPLPLGGTQAIWFREYNDLFSYPPDASPASLFSDGLTTFVNSRLEALTNNFNTFVVVEGMVVFTPLMLLGLWIKRPEKLLRPFWLYVLGLHLAMTFVFAFPGYRGGLFHSAAALVPFWMTLSLVGLDASVDWIARRRRHWRAPSAKLIFSIGFLLLAIGLSAFTALQAQSVRDDANLLYTELDTRLPVDARIMANDPAAIYYYIGRGGVVLPNEAPDVILELARLYAIDYILLETQQLDDGSRVFAIPTPLDPLLDDLPDFLTPIAIDYPHARLYAINR